MLCSPAAGAADRFPTETIETLRAIVDCGGVHSAPVPGRSPDWPVVDRALALAAHGSPLPLQKPTAGWRDGHWVAEAIVKPPRARAPPPPPVHASPLDAAAEGARVSAVRVAECMIQSEKLLLAAASPAAGSGAHTTVSREWRGAAAVPPERSAPREENIAPLQAPAPAVAAAEQLAEKAQALLGCAIAQHEAALDALDTFDPAYGRVYRESLKLVRDKMRRMREREYDEGSQQKRRRKLFIPRRAQPQEDDERSDSSSAGSSA